MYLVDLSDDRLVYTPPDFIAKKLSSRQPLVDLAAKINDGADVFDCIFEFESNIR